ncbi:MAG: glucosyl transferase [Ignavibacteriales bacterium]|nr:glucosyl transferase [Ignavibacteriales bacterium]
MEVRSNGLTVTTLVPTSQNFTWQAYSWGMHSSSTLYDVAIINENDIWVVGEIYMNDSLGNPDPACYNAVHWDSSGNWQKKKIKTNSCGGVDYPPIKTIFAFSKDDILFAHIDGSISHFNGVEFINDCSLITQLDGSANKIWGIASNDFYVVSSNGFIAHYQNGSWQKIESGTNIDFRDIYGSANEDTNELEIIALASNILAKPGKRLLRIKNQTVQTLPDSGLSNYLSTIWFMSDRKYCLGGQGYYESRTFGPVWERNTSMPQFHITSIRGAGLNDIVLGGTFGLLMHYNGVSWMNYANITAAYFDVISSVAIKGNTISCCRIYGK